MRYAVKLNATRYPLKIMSKIYDLIIIGAGPAGITAGIYAARKRMGTLILTDDIGGQTTWSGDIENYTGYQFITGPDLVEKFEEHIKKYDIKVKEGEPVLELVKKGDLVWMRTNKGEYRSRTAIIASGKRSREMGVPGEKEFRNKGLTYCATCDGPLFAGKDVVVVGGGNSALEAVIQLMAIANRIYIVNKAAALTGDAILREKAEKSDKIIIMNEAIIDEVFGKDFVEGVVVNIGGKKSMVKAGGVFVEIGLIPNSEFVNDIEKNDNGEIVVECSTDTSEPGIFAAGDVTNVPEKQIIIAAGEGSKAALRAFNYLARKK